MGSHSGKGDAAVAVSTLADPGRPQDAQGEAGGRKRDADVSVPLAPCRRPAVRVDTAREAAALALIPPRQAVRRLLRLTNRTAAKREDCWPRTSRWRRCAGPPCCSLSSVALSGVAEADGLAFCLLAPRPPDTCRGGGTEAVVAVPEDREERRGDEKRRWLASARPRPGAKATPPPYTGCVGRALGSPDLLAALCRASRGKCAAEARGLALALARRRPVFPQSRFRTTK